MKLTNRYGLAFFYRILIALLEIKLLGLAITKIRLKRSESSVFFPFSFLFLYLKFIKTIFNCINETKWPLMQQDRRRLVHVILHAHHRGNYITIPARRSNKIVFRHESFDIFQELLFCCQRIKIMFYRQPAYLKAKEEEKTRDRRSLIAVLTIAYSPLCLIISLPTSPPCQF